ncbi:MAG: hypothetical protein DHS20C15_10620 [Planctomycetota bacterium]|nr:MAG: hypothetical protein DHS20C15_10620 [Planctomycetota bacterium]
MDFDVTEACNLGCVYCFKNELTGPTMSFETAQRSLEWLLEASANATSVNVNFMGGEPTLAWGMIERFVPWARRRGRACGKLVTFSMTSNLTLWTDEIREFVDRYGFGILMSIDGCPDVQDTQRPAKNGKKVSETVAKWATSLLRTRPGSQARMTLHPDHVGRLHESLTYLRGLGFREVAMASADYGAWTPDHFERLSVQLDTVIDDIVASYAGGEPFNLTVFKYYVGKLVAPRRRAEEVEIRRQPCGAGKGYLMVDHTGDVWPCHRFDGADEDAGGTGEMRLANIFKSGFNHELQRVFTDFDHLEQHKDRCTTCPVNEICGGFCPAANLSETGSLYTPHDAFCDWSQLLYAAAERLYHEAEQHGVLEALLKDSAEVESDGQR